MPTPTYTPLANLTLGSSAATVTFSSINTSLYRDLVLVTSITSSDATGAYTYLWLNSDSGENYSFVSAWGNGSSGYSAASTATSVGTITSGNPPHSTSNREIATYNIMDYSATDKHKTVLIRSSSASVLTGMAAYRWASTSAVNSLSLFTRNGYSQSQDFLAGSTFALYGIAA